MISKKTFIFGTALCLLGFASGCGSGNKVVAVVNGQVITAKELDRRMSRLNPSARAAIGNDRRRLVEEMVMETVLTQEARRRGLDNDAEVRLLINEARRQIMLGRLLEVIRQEGQTKVSDEEIAKFYEKNKDKIIEPETFRASHILVEGEEAAKKALARVNGGEAFSKVAEEVSTDPTKSKGGDLGYFTKGQLIPEFEAACEKLKPGEISPIVKSPLGYHLILLTERRPSRSLSLDEVREQIRRQLIAQQQQQKVGTFVQQVRSKAQVKIHEEAIPTVQNPSAPNQPSPSSPKNTP